MVTSRWLSRGEKLWGYLQHDLSVVKRCIKKMKSMNLQFFEEDFYIFLSQTTARTILLLVYIFLSWVELPRGILRTYCARGSMTQVPLPSLGKSAFWCWLAGLWSLLSTTTPGQGKQPELSPAGAGQTFEANGGILYTSFQLLPASRCSCHPAQI